eukprot:PhF_6_TR39767/c0_g1_i1/m.59167
MRILAHLLPPTTEERTRAQSKRRSKSASMPLSQSPTRVSPSMNSPEEDLLFDHAVTTVPPSLPPRGEKGPQGLVTLKPSRSTKKVTGTVLVETPERVQTMTDMFTIMHVGNRETRAKIPTSLPLEIEELQDAAQARVAGARGEDRQRQLSSVWKQCAVFIQRLPEETEEIDTSWKVIWFLEAKINMEAITISTAYKYVKDIRQILREMKLPHDPDVLTSALKSYERAGAMNPLHQAPPATRDVVEAAMQTATPTERIGLWLAWKTASRNRRRTSADAGKSDLGASPITHPVSPAQGRPVQIGNGIGSNSRERKRSQIHERFGDTYQEQGSSEQTYRDNHSKNDGPVTDSRPKILSSLDQEGSSISPTQSEDSTKCHTSQAKHKDLETLYTYLPRDEVAMAIGIHEATRVL